MAHSDPTDVEWYARELDRVSVGGARPLSVPIEIVDYRPEWPRLYAREESRIRAALGDRVVRIEHVGWKYGQQYADAKTAIVPEILARAEAAGAE